MFETLWIPAVVVLAVALLLWHHGHMAGVLSQLKQAGKTVVEDAKEEVKELTSKVEKAKEAVVEKSVEVTKS